MGSGTGVAQAHLKLKRSEGRLEEIDPRKS